MVIRGSQSSAKKWMETYQFPYPLILDPELNVFGEFGRKRNVKNTWKLSALTYYAECSLADIPFTPPYEGDDIHLMAGDYVSDSSGKLVYAFNGLHSFHKPPVQEIINALDRAL